MSKILESRTVLFPYAQVFFGKSLTYTGEALFVLYEGDTEYVLSSCSVTSNKDRKTTIDLTDLIKTNEEVQKHVLQVLGDNWEDGGMDSSNWTNDIARAARARDNRLKAGKKP